MQFRLVPPLPPGFVGLDNYAAALSQPRFWQSVGFTFLLAGLQSLPRGVYEAAALEKCQPVAAVSRHHLSDARRIHQRPGLG